MVKPMELDNEFFDISDSDIEFDLSSVSAEPYFEYDNKIHFF